MRIMVMSHSLKNGDIKYVIRRSFHFNSCRKKQNKKRSFIFKNNKQIAELINHAFNFNNLVVYVNKKIALRFDYKEEKHALLIALDEQKDKTIKITLITVDKLDNRHYTIGKQFHRENLIDIDYRVNDSLESKAYRSVCELSKFKLLTTEKCHHYAEEFKKYLRGLDGLAHAIKRSMNSRTTPLIGYGKPFLLKVKVFNDEIYYLKIHTTLEQGISKVLLYDLFKSGPLINIKLKRENLHVCDSISNHSHGFIFKGVPIRKHIRKVK